MPTPTGLPKAGEVWEKTVKLPPDWQPHTTRFVVIQRGRGDYWSLRVAVRNGDHYKMDLWVDAAYAMQQGQLRYIGPAGPITRKTLNLG